VIEKGSDVMAARIIGGRWDGATGQIIERAAEYTIIRLDSGITLRLETAAEDVQVIPRELGS
jgi:hypothetical protein